jgi:hypothetical protein
MSATLAFPRFRVGEPIRHEALCVFPLFPMSAPAEEVDYRLADEAVADGTVVIEEINDSGSVPTLRVTNKGAHRVLFLEGEELRGAKQNRVLNTSVLIGAMSKATIPVSCVEQGRWRFRTRQFTFSDSYSSSKLRHFLKKSVSDSLRKGQGHSSDQGAVWGEVSRQMTSLGSISETHAMADTYESHRPRLEEFRARVGYVEGAVGLAVAVGPTVVAVDLFDKPATCRKIWDRLLSGFIMDALEAGKAERSAGPAEVNSLLDRLQQAPWQESPAVGEGREFRADAEPATHASALMFASSVLHGSAMVGAGV